MCATSNLLNGWNFNSAILSVDIFLYQAVIDENIAGLFLSSKLFKDYEFQFTGGK